MRKFVAITPEVITDDFCYENKQHIFKPIEIEYWYRDIKRIGNKSLCGHIKLGDEECLNAKFSELIELNEPINPEKICKKCLKIYNKLIKQ